MPQKIYYEIDGTNSINDLKNKTENSLKILKRHLQNAPIDVLDSSEINDLLKNYESSALALRYVSQQKHEAYADDSSIDVGTCDYPIDINYGNKILKIKMPLSVYRDRNTSHFLSAYVSAALTIWKQNHPETSFLFEMKPPFSVVILRVSTEWNARLIRDHDNLENGRVINSIFDAMCFSDNALNADLYSAFRISKEKSDVGMYVFVFPRTQNSSVLPSLLDGNCTLEQTNE